MDSRYSRARSVTSAPAARRARICSRSVGSVAWFWVSGTGALRCPLGHVEGDERMGRPGRSGPSLTAPCGAARELLLRGVCAHHGRFVKFPNAASRAARLRVALMAMVIEGLFASVIS